MNILLIVFYFNRMIRKLHTRAGHRQNYYHENDSAHNKVSANSIIRPPTCHPYSAYKNNKSESQLRSKYSPTYFFDTKIDNSLKQAGNKLQIYHHIDKLPAQIKHLINQLRVSIRNQLNNKKCPQIEEMIHMVAKSINNLKAQKDESEKQNEKNQEKIKELDEEIVRLNKNLNKFEKNPKAKGQKNKAPNYEQQLLLENCKLGEMNARYLERIAILESQTNNLIEINSQEKDPTNRCDTQLLRSQNRISYLQIKLNSAQKTENQLLASIEELQKKICSIKQENSELSQQNQHLREKMNNWRQRAMMQKEDGETQINRQQFLLYSLRKLRENNKNLLEKLLAQNQNSERIQRKNYIQNTNFQYEIDFFKNLGRVYEKGKGEKFYSDDEIKKNELGVEIEETLFAADYHNYKKEDKFHIHGLKFFRPSFYAFLEESATSDISECRNKQSNSVSRIFIQILRSIMNSKLNQFLYIDSVQKYTRFPEFVYAWFEKYYFNSEKKCVLMLQPYMQKPISQEIFYRDLMNVKLDQSWEIITFREFLLEELSLEELYFYLICQNLLYTKAGITKQVQYHGDFNILVEYSAAKSIIDITLNDFETWNITFLNSKLREKIIIKNKREMIEAGFFLRCLIEYYRIERSNRYRYISKLSSEFKDAKKGLRFSSFMSIINKFTELPMEQKLKVYRDCYCISKGVITPESIFTVCHENLIFLKYLKMKGLYRFPKIIAKPLKYSMNFDKFKSTEKEIGSQKICLHPSDDYLYTMILQFKKTIEQQNSLISRTESLGVSQILNQILYMMKALDERNSQINSNILRGKHFIQYFCELMEKIRKITLMNFYELLEEQWKKKNKEFWVEVSETQLGEIFAEEITATFHTYHRVNQIRVWKNKIYNFRVHTAARRIQNQVKKKFIEPLQLLYKILNHDKPVTENNMNQQPYT